MKLRKVSADLRIIQGHIAHPPMQKPNKLARRMLRYLGARVPISGFVISARELYKISKNKTQIDVPVANATEFVLRLTEI